MPDDDRRDVPDLLTGMATTRAIRRIAPDPVPDDDLATMLWHATRAPSGTNRQPTRFVVLRSGPTAERAKAVLARGFRDGWNAKISDAGYDEGSSLDPTSRKGRQRAAMQHFVDHFEEIPVVVLPCLVRYREPYTGEGAWGLGKPLKSITHPLRADLPIFLGAEGPKNVAMTAEIAWGTA